MDISDTKLWSACENLVRVISSLLKLGAKYMIHNFISNRYLFPNLGKIFQYNKNQGGRKETYQLLETYQ